MMTVSARAKLDAKMAAEAQAKYGKTATPVAA
jgi:hypothetical protein